MELHCVDTTVSIKLVSLILILCGILSLTKLDGCLGNLDRRHHVHVGCLDVERNALLEFKHGITEDPSGRLSSWAGQDCCKWRGVGCDDTTRHVINLNLRNLFPDCYRCNDNDHRLYGEISSSLVVLKHLSYLDLSYNRFTVRRGQNLSFIGSLWNLRYLNLSSAISLEDIRVNFPFKSIGNLSRLRYLDISYGSKTRAQMTRYYSFDNVGTISSLHWLPHLTSLKYLDLGNWNLSDVSPYLFQTVNNALPTLQELYLSSCQLENLHPLVNLTSLMVLDLSSNNLNYTLPYWLFNLKSLVHLYLGENNFHGPLPDLNIRGELSKNMGNLCNLQTLDLSENGFSGEITNFLESLSGCSNSRIESLDLSYNDLVGSLPNSLGVFKSLKYLDLHNNTFQGSIPNSIGKLTSLEELDLSSNNLSGIPKSIGQLSMLTKLDISGNFWEGVITEAQLVNLSSLKELQIDQSSSDVSLVFNISSDWLPPFKLTYLEIHSCRLGPKFPTWLKNQNELTVLILVNATISDIVPNWFWQLDLQLTGLDFSLNNMSGKVPNLLKMNYHSTINLVSNHFDGPLPIFSSNITFLYLSNNQFSGAIPSNIGEAMPVLEEVDISHNSLNGTIPFSLGNLKYLGVLVMSNNHLTGQLPNIWANMSSVEMLDMSNNHFSGTIPRSIGSLARLNYIILSNNNFFGEFPSFMKNCSSSLFGLDIGDNKFFGELPKWLGVNMSILSILNMRSNFFTGNISSEICGLSKLHVLDISDNGLIGHIPHCIGNLSGMKSGTSMRADGVPLRTTSESFKIVGKGRELDYKYEIRYVVNSFDLSNNNLSGEIPVELTSLIKLGTLNLSMNHLIGKIPVDIGNMKLLETLDLSMNKLVGQIPVSMTSLTFLSHLNLSYNNLSGRIPTGNQLQTLEDPSIYQGNVGLCGKPLHNNCSDDNDQNSTQGSNKEDKEGNKFENLGFFISMALGFIVGFWGVFGTLSIKKSWRKAYFGFVDRVTTKAFRCFH